MLFTKPHNLPNKRDARDGLQPRVIRVVERIKRTDHPRAIVPDAALFDVPVCVCAYRKMIDRALRTR
jgi:hypothetical protein